MSSMTGSPDIGSGLLRPVPDTRLIRDELDLLELFEPVPCSSAARPWLGGSVRNPYTTILCYR